MLGDRLSPTTCVIGSPKVGRESYPYHLAGSVLIVGLAIQNTDSSDSTVAAILNHRPEIHTKQQLKWRARQGERRTDSCYGWNRSSAPPCGAGGKSRRVASNGASGRFELDWRLGEPSPLAYFCS